LWAQLKPDVQWLMRFRHIAMSLLLFVGTSGMQCREAADIIEQFHFTILKPPSTLYFVGAVVAVELDNTGKLETGTLKLVCGPRGHLGRSWSPLVSHTVTESVKNSSRSSWNLDAAVFADLKSQTSLESLQSVRCELKNAKIYTISDTDILENIKYRSEDCKRAILARLQAGYAVTVISSAIMADMDYHVEFKQEGKLDKRMRARQLSDVAISLGGGHTRISEKVIESKGLALGIKTDSFLMGLSMQTPAQQAEEQHFEGLEEDRTVQMREANTSDASDSKLVLPNGYVQPLVDF
jgi:hypothetical protein